MPGLFIYNLSCVYFDCISVPALTKIVEVAKPICSDISHFSFFADILGTAALSFSN